MLRNPSCPNQSQSTSKSTPLVNSGAMTRSSRRRPTTNRAARSGRMTQILRAYLHTSGGICHLSVVPGPSSFALGIGRTSKAGKVTQGQMRRKNKGNRLRINDKEQLIMRQTGKDEA